MDCCVSALTIAYMDCCVSVLTIASYGLLCECIDNTFIWTALGVHWQ